MRLELAGSLIHPAPLILRFDADATFNAPTYENLGFTHFEVICIGAGGGRGGGIDTANSGTQLKCCGGAGGGGGYHRVRGLLSALPRGAAQVKVGAGGAIGTSHASNPSLTTNGGDGGPSTFNGLTCRASGGEGGKRVQTNSPTASTIANGGDGGIGNRSIAGGGGIGGVSGTPSPTGPGVAGSAGQDGTLFNDIGKGGGGGAGGVAKYGGVVCNAGTAGGRGSYNPGDTSVYGPGFPTSVDSATGVAGVVAGAASGAKASPLNGLPTVFGQSRNDLPGNPGVVILRLTAE